MLCGLVAVCFLLQQTDSKAQEQEPMFVEPQKVTATFLQGGATEALVAKPVISIHRKIRPKRAVKTQLQAQKAVPDLGQALHNRLSRSPRRLQSGIQDDLVGISIEVTPQPTYSLKADESQVPYLRPGVAQDAPAPRFQLPVLKFEGPLAVSAERPSAPLTANAKQDVVPNIANTMITGKPGYGSLLPIAPVDVTVNKIRPGNIAGANLLTGNGEAIAPIVPQKDMQPNLSNEVVSAQIKKGESGKLIAAAGTTPLLSASSVDTQGQLLQSSNNEAIPQIVQADSSNNNPGLLAQSLGTSGEVVGKLQITTRPLSEKAVPLATSVRPRSATRQEQISWDGWNANFDQLLEPYIVSALEKRQNPGGRTVLEITVWPDHRLAVKVTESQDESFTSAIVEACTSLEGHTELAFPVGARRKKHRFENEYKFDGGPVSRVDSNIEKGDID